jgi:hypothetical protein
MRVIAVIDHAAVIEGRVQSEHNADYAQREKRPGVFRARSACAAAGLIFLSLLDSG